jgi:hypothetical protein
MSGAKTTSKRVYIKKTIIRLFERKQDKGKISLRTVFLTGISKVRFQAGPTQSPNL